MPANKRGRGTASRPIQVGEQIKELLSTMLIEGRVKDPRLAEAAMLTVTEVRVTNDLKHAKALISIFPEDEKIVKAVMTGLISAKKEIQRAIGSELRLRAVPMVEFVHDDSIINGMRIEKVLRDIKTEESAARSEREQAAKPAADDGEVD